MTDSPGRRRRTGASSIRTNTKRPSSLSLFTPAAAAASRAPQNAPLPPYKRRRKTYASNNSSHSTRRSSSRETFIVSQPCLALVEGFIQHVDACDYAQDVFHTGRYESLPQYGRYLEIPFGVLQGIWQAEFVQEMATTTTTTASSRALPSLEHLREHAKDLRGVRLCLRHADYQKLGLLLPTNSRNEKRDDVDMSVLRPWIQRDRDVQKQGLDEYYEYHDDDADNAMTIGSLSIVGVDDFTSPSKTRTTSILEQTAKELQLLQRAAAAVVFVVPDIIPLTTTIGNNKNDAEDSSRKSTATNSSSSAASSPNSEGAVGPDGTHGLATILMAVHGLYDYRIVLARQVGATPVTGAAAMNNALVVGMDIVFGCLRNERSGRDSLDSTTTSSTAISRPLKPMALTQEVLERHTQSYSAAYSDMTTGVAGIDDDQKRIAFITTEFDAANLLQRPAAGQSATETGANTLNSKEHGMDDGGELAGVVFKNIADLAKGNGPSRGILRDDADPATAAAPVTAKDKLKEPNECDINGKRAADESLTNSKEMGKSTILDTAPMEDLRSARVKELIKPRRKDIEYRPKNPPLKPKEIKQDYAPDSFQSFFLSAIQKPAPKPTASDAKAAAKTEKKTAKKHASEPTVERTSRNGKANKSGKDAFDNTSLDTKEKAVKRSVNGEIGQGTNMHVASQKLLAGHDSAEEATDSACVAKVHRRRSVGITFEQDTEQSIASSCSKAIGLQPAAVESSAKQQSPKEDSVRQDDIAEFKIVGTVGEVGIKRKIPAMTSKMSRNEPTSATSAGRHVSALANGTDHAHRDRARMSASDFVVRKNQQDFANPALELTLFPSSAKTKLLVLEKKTPLDGAKSDITNHDSSGHHHYPDRSNTWTPHQAIIVSNRVSMSEGPHRPVPGLNKPITNLDHELQRFLASIIDDSSSCDGSIPEEEKEEENDETETREVSPRLPPIRQQFESMESFEIPMQEPPASVGCGAVVEGDGCDSDQEASHDPEPADDDASVSGPPTFTALVHNTFFGVYDDASFTEIAANTDVMMSEIAESSDAIVSVTEIKQQYSFHDALFGDLTSEPEVEQRAASVVSWLTSAFLVFTLFAVVYHYPFMLGPFSATEKSAAAIPDEAAGMLE